MPHFQTARDVRKQLEADPELWLHSLFPSYVTHPFSPAHREFWDHIWSLVPGIRPSAYIAIWARGWAKSTSAELATACLAAREVRKYALYVCGSQDQADDHVANIASMLESPRFGVMYPKAASRRLSKYGHSRGWRRNRLRTASGFTIDAIGLDTTARGVKMDEDRPDLMVLDDLDEEHDDRRAVEKKILSLTRKLLPAGSEDLAVIGIQNLVHRLSIFSQIADGTAEFLHDRIVSGPIPAVRNLEVVRRKGEYIIEAGEATWVGMDLDTCEEKINDWGLTAFLNESQHNVTPPPGGMFNHILPHVPHVEADDLRVKGLLRKVCWVDPAVSDTDQSDSHAIQIDGLGKDGKIYRLYSWEDRTSPRDALKRAILKAVEWQCDHVGIETDQGGDTWEDVYFNARRDAEKTLGHRIYMPMKSAKAGQIGSKTHRASLMLADYERDGIRHVNGTHELLEAALARFPKTKPFDLTDASFWSWRDLREMEMGFDEEEVVESPDEYRVSISAF